MDLNFSTQPIAQTTPDQQSASKSNLSLFTSYPKTLFGSDNCKTLVGNDAIHKIGQANKSAADKKPALSNLTSISAEHIFANRSADVNFTYKSMSAKRPMSLVPSML